MNEVEIISSKVMGKFKFDFFRNQKSNRDQINNHMMVKSNHNDFFQPKEVIISSYIFIFK